MSNEKQLWEYFFNKERKYYNKYMYEMEKFPEYLIYDDEKIINSKGKWSKEVFKNDKPLELEIGCGSAMFTNELARLNKNVNFIGVEIRFKRLVQAARKAKKLELDNLVFIRKRITSLKEFISNQELSALYINFPDPWEKAPEKRIFSKELLKDLDEILINGGKIYFKTDHDDYYNSILELINNTKAYNIVYHTNDLYSSPKIENNIKTEFEHLFLYRKNKTIKYIEIQKSI